MGASRGKLDFVGMTVLGLRVKKMAPTNVGGYGIWDFA